MNFQNLLNQFTGSNTTSQASHHHSKTSSLGSGMIGGAAAGGVMALLVGSKKGRKFAGKAATVGGAALIGGIAFKAYKSWQQNNQSSAGKQPSSMSSASDAQATAMALSEDFHLTLIKAMICAAKSDGHIDEVEQKRIFDSVEKMAMGNEMKGLVFDLLRQPIYIEELVHGAQDMQQKSEVYLASCLAIDLDNPLEFSYLNKLAGALGLPSDLAEEIKTQAKQALDSERVLN